MAFEDDGVSDDKLVEVRFLAPADHVAVIDAIAHVHGTDRATEMKSLLRQKHDAELHRASVVCRVLRVNPLDTDSAGSAGKGSGK